MKKLFYFTIAIILPLLIGCNEKRPVQNNSAILYISKTDSGFNIYPNKKELLLDYTKLNCDSLSLETLNEIYSTAKEFYGKHIPKEEKQRPSLKGA